MPDVREMTDRMLLSAVSFYTEKVGQPERDELSRRLSGLRAEVERLKAEAATMRELCEATSELGGGIHPHAAYMDGKRRWYLALDAYRALKKMD